MITDMLTDNYNIIEIFRNIKKDGIILFENSILNIVKKSFLKTKLIPEMSLLMKKFHNYAFITFEIKETINY